MKSSMNKILLLFALLICPLMSSASSLRIDGSFNGWNGETIVKLNDGTYWMQSSYYYHSCSNYNPQVELFSEYGRVKMTVKGCGSRAIEVKQLTEVIEARIVSDFNGFDNGNIYQLDNGQTWKQTGYKYAYSSKSRPEIFIYKDRFNYKMQLLDDGSTCEVELVDGYTSNTQPQGNYETYIKVQNNTGYVLYYCYAAYYGANGWQSNGWYKAEAYSSSKIYIGNYSGKIYLYAEYNSGEKSWTGQNSNYSFCVDKTNAFKIANADRESCTGSSYKRVNMGEYDITPGIFTWTLTP